MPEPKQEKTPEKPVKLRESLNIDIRPRGEQPKSYLWLWVGLGALGLIILILLIIPAYRGYQVYRAMQDSGIPEQYLTNMTALHNDKVALESQLSDEKASVERLDQELSSMQTQVGSCKVELNSCRDDASAAAKRSTDLIDSLGEDIANVRNDQETLQATIADAARRLCCVQRVENPSINSYAVVEDKIVCVQDGGTPISC